MSANIGQIVAEITANTAGLRRGAADAQRILNDTSNNASVAGKAIGIAFAVTAAVGVMKLIDKLEDCTQVAIDNKKALMGLESVAKAYGVSVEDATKATKDFTQDGLLQMKSATTGMKNILSTGFNVSEAMNLTQAMKDIGAFNNVTGDLGQAFEDATKGMRTGSIELIENIGLTQKLSAVMKNANIDISNGIDLTNNAAQREAFYNMVLKEGEKFKGNAAKLADDQASSQAKANAAMKEAADAIGNRLLPAYSGLMKSVADLSKMATDIFKVSEISKATTAMENQKMELYSLTDAYLELKSKSTLTADEAERYKKIIGELEGKYGEYIKNINLEKDSYNDVKIALEEASAALLKYTSIQLAQADIKDATTKSVKEQQKLNEQLEKSNSLYIKAKKELSGNKTVNIATETNEIGAPIFRPVNTSTLEKMYNELVDIVNNKSGKVTEAERKQASKRKNILEQSLISDQNLSVNGSNILKLLRDEKNYKDVSTMIQGQIIKSKSDFNKQYKDILKKWSVDTSDFVEEITKKESSGSGEVTTKIDKKIEVEPKIEITDPDPPWIEVQNLIYSQFAKITPEITPVIDFDTLKVAKQQIALGLTNPDKYMTTYAQQGAVNEESVTTNSDYVKKSLDDVTKSFSELASVLDNEVISAISNIANQAVSMGSNIKGFSAAQGAGDKLGMLSSGLGVFSSAVGIFQTVGGLFSKSTYNFDEAVKKMLAGIGEKTPNIQIAEYQKGIDLKKYLEEQGIAGKYYSEITKEQKDYLSSLGVKTKETITVDSGSSSSTGAIKTTYTLGKTAIELLGTVDKIIPQLSEQLGTAAADFGSAIGSALSSSATSEELKANLYDSVYGTVKSGLINAFLAGEVMKPLLDKLQQTVTLAVASGGIDGTEKEAIQKLFGEVGIKTDEFYSALEAVGLNVVDAAGQLNEAADRMDNVNRNLRLADRISTITTQTSTAGITQLAGNSSIVYDFSNANLGGMTEQQIVTAVSKANRMASIRKVGV